jgi:phosphotransacetylase
MDYEQICLAIADIDEPIVVFTEGESDQNLSIAKRLMLDKKADVIVIGDEINITQSCRRLKINETMFYGVLNPRTYPQKEAYLAWIHKQYPELNSEHRKVQSRDIPTFVAYLKSEGIGDLVI